jgi:hypothetical protein
MIIIKMIKERKIKMIIVIINLKKLIGIKGEKLYKS